MKKYFYKTIAKHNEYEIPKIKWSKFIGNIFHIKDQNDIKKYIDQTKENHKWANHHCYAYVLDTNISFDTNNKITIQDKIQKENDDGEPKNSAWKPILAQINWNNLHNVLIVVSRYFWWTKLWVWWLIQAYWDCAKQTIQQTKTTKIEITKEITISFDYKYLSNIMNTLQKYNCKIIKENHWELATILFKINKWQLNNFSQEIFDQTKWEIKI